MSSCVRSCMQIKVRMCSRRDGISRRCHQLRTIAIDRMGWIVGIVDSAGLQVINWGTETLLLRQLGSRTNITQRFHHRRRAQSTAHDIFDTVIRNEMMRDSRDGDAHGLLDQP